MTSIVLFCLWVVAANVVAMLPSRDGHWTAAYILIVVGIPLLGYLTWQNGPIVGFIGLVAGMSVLRWPLVMLTRWVKEKLGR
ncbi:DUF2484 family protein [Marinibacterium profundimaris]|uniref:UDP-N-acetylmuramate--alanine ligase n=1 Tax=Marinibacterium profundimaris TaxID=1679460 RepID=A0A225NSR1_9RHOB|nr:DUF2484 family protein [Marinibacterium profundimaris]OWU77974.1 hypothetical protein ATO3_04920 [Marinibacterium profundimaris]